MNNWQAYGAIMTGVAALITAGIGIYEKLKTVQTEIYKEVTAEQEPVLKKEYGIVNDPDGWVNLRESPNINSVILARILNDTHLEILKEEGNWFHVYTESGRKGYIFKNRLILKNE